MRRIFRLLSIIFVIIFVTTGCIDQGSVSVKSLDQQIETSCDMSNLKKGDSKELEKLYKINKVELQDFVLYTSKSKNNAEEILVLKVKYLSSIGELRYKIEKRLNEQADKFKKSSPKEYKLIKNDLLQDRQNFIIFVISKDKSNIEKKFNEVVQQ